MVNGGVLRCGPNSCMPHGSATGFKTINAHVHGLGRKQLRPEPLAICHARSPIDELDLENREPMQNPKSSVPGSLGYSFTPGGLLVPYYIGNLLQAGCSHNVFGRLHAVFEGYPYCATTICRVVVYALSSPECKQSACAAQVSCVAWKI